MNLFMDAFSGLGGYKRASHEAPLRLAPAAAV